MNQFLNSLITLEVIAAIEEKINEGGPSGVEEIQLDGIHFQKFTQDIKKKLGL